MEIDKHYLEEKLNIFIAQHKQATEELNKYSVLVRKIEGAIEATQLLIKDLVEEKKSDLKKIK